LEEALMEPSGSYVLLKYRLSKDTTTDTDVAIKRVGSRNFDEPILTKRALRELKLLRHLNGHENIIQFVDANTNDSSSNFTEL
jgi:mitogen-activated protein kinase 7